MCRDETTELRAMLAEVTDLLEDMVWQHCQDRDGRIDSMALSANAEAIEFLIRAKRLERIGDKAGRRVFARERETASNPKKGT